MLRQDALGFLGDYSRWWFCFISFMIIVVCSFEEAQPEWPDLIPASYIFGDSIRRFIRNWLKSALNRPFLNKNFCIIFVRILWNCLRLFWRRDWKGRGRYSPQGHLGEDSLHTPVTSDLGEDKSRPFWHRLLGTFTAGQVNNQNSSLSLSFILFLFLLFFFLLFVCGWGLLLASSASNVVLDTFLGGIRLQLGIN